MKISKEVFNRSTSWIKRNARPLESARWEYLFESGSRDQIIHYLSAFQNEDGGFGHGIEPDFWLPASSPMATWTAGQILMEIGAGPKEKIVQSMISYLASTNQRETGMWFSVLPENNQYPHAPWWSWKEKSQDNWMFNPSAELAAFLVHWSPEESEEAQIGWSSIQKAVNRIMSIKEMDRHELNNYQQLVKIMKLHETTFNDKLPYSLNVVSDKVMLLIEQTMDKNILEWSSGYKAHPLEFIDRPNHPLSRKHEDLIEQNLKFYIKQLSDEGAWDISWSWSNYPEEFPIARRYWKGILTVKRYKILKSFGYIE